MQFQSDRQKGIESWSLWGLGPVFLSSGPDHRVWALLSSSGVLLSLPQAASVEFTLVQGSSNYSPWATSSLLLFL